MEGETLSTMFQLNVQGMTTFVDELVINGMISAIADGTASETNSNV